MPFALCRGCDHVFVIDSAAAAHRQCPTCKLLLQVLQREEGLARLRERHNPSEGVPPADGTQPLLTDPQLAEPDLRARAVRLLAEAENLIYVAPPDHHLILKRGHLRLTRGPRENSHRPAVDPLFRTAAQHYGPRVAGVVLSGMLDDGAAGLAAIKSRGGVALVQDPEEALYPSMPRNALLNVEVDHVLPVAAMPPLLERLAREPVAEGDEAVPDEMDVENKMAELELGALKEDQRPGTPTGFTCPECHGVLWELRDGQMIRYRCRVGHAYSPDSLLAERSDALEAALWMALQALEESAALARRLAPRARERNHLLSAEQFEAQATDAQGRAECIRDVLLQPLPVEGFRSAAVAPAASRRLDDGGERVSG